MIRHSIETKPVPRIFREEWIHRNPVSQFGTYPDETRDHQVGKRGMIVILATLRGVPLSPRVSD